MAFDVWELIAKTMGGNAEEVKGRAKTWAQEKCKDMIAVYLCECGHMAWEHEGMTEECRRCSTEYSCRKFKMHPRAIVNR